MFSCTNEVDFGIEEEPIATLNDELNLTDGVIIGEKLRNPYSLDVMRQACDLLYPPTRGEDPVSDSLITPNVKYVRFLPTDSTEYRTLSTSGYELFNYPLDYDILGDPSDYHDPNLPPEQITWQYTVMPIEDPLPISSAEVLELGYIPDPADDLNSAYDLEAIEDTANGIINEMTTDRLAGGITSGVTVTNTSTPPTINTDSEIVPHVGEIEVCDKGTMDESTPRGVKGVKVRARHYFKIRTAYTDEKGRYFIDLNEFKDCNPRFELRFENKYGFKIGYGLKLIMPSTFDMKGVRSYRFNAITTDEGKYKAWVLSTINNAAYDWYERCEKEGMPTPPKDLYIWAMEVAGGAACPMFHHNTIQMAGLSIPAIVRKYFDFDDNIIRPNIFNALVELVAPDVCVFGVDKIDTPTMYDNTCHELAHAAHFQQVGSTVNERAMWWADVIQYEIACGIVEGPYEATGVPHSGKVGVTEMWAHAVGHIMEYEYSGDAMKNHPDAGKYWFKPEIIWELYKLGMPLSDISKSMVEDVVSLSDFKWQLMEDNESFATQIDSLFVKYL